MRRIVLRRAIVAADSHKANAGGSQLLGSALKRHCNAFGKRRRRFRFVSCCGCVTFQSFDETGTAHDKRVRVQSSKTPDAAHGYCAAIVAVSVPREPNLRKGPTMATGTVKWFNAAKGFGFIQPDAGGGDVFVHISAVEKAGLNGLNDGQKISYDVVSERGKNAAANLQLG
jgi:cold shock protein